MLRTLTLLLAASASSLFGGSVLLSPGGTARLGVHDTGALGWASTGLRLVGLGDAITPGCVCESWGVSAGSTAGYAYPFVAGVSGLALNSFSGGSASATSVMTLTGTGLRVTQAFTNSSYEGIFRNTVTLTNTGSGTLSDVRYARAIDWDVPPTVFNELVTIQRGGSTALLYSNDNGFAAANPLSPGAALNSSTQNADVVDNGPDDHGSLFVFGFGSLAPGQSRTFNVFFGATSSEASALAGLAAVGAEAYSLGQSFGNGGTGSPGTFLMAFSGVGGRSVASVPEPAMLVLAFLCAGAAANMRRRVTA